MNSVSHDPAAGGEENMARDVALLERGRPCGRVYSWNGPWVSLGRFQKPETALLSSSVPWVSRPTGGKGVLHGHDATIGLAIPLTAIGLADSRSVGPVYRRVVRLIVQALNESGVACCLGEDSRFVGQGERTADCFGHVSKNDVVDPVTGQKVCGCALKLCPTAVLVQASVPIKRPLVDPASVFASPGPASWRELDPAQLVLALNRAVTPLEGISYNSPS